MDGSREVEEGGKEMDVIVVGSGILFIKSAFFKIPFEF